MSAEDLLRVLSQALFVLIFPVVGMRAVRHPRRANIDTALLFGAVAFAVALGWIPTVPHSAAARLVGVVTGTFAMAIPYLLLRLVDDFTPVPRRLLHLAEAGLAIAIVALLIFPKLPAGILLLLVAYFVVLATYDAAAFVGAARRGSGVTRRRMQAAAIGSFGLGLTILEAGLIVIVPVLNAVWIALGAVTLLCSGAAYLVAFTPPRWLRRSWQEPEVRAFLGRAASLPRLPDTGAIVRELEAGAASSLGAPAASISLWDDDAQVLRYESGDQRIEQTPVSGATLTADTFATQQARLTDNARRDYPALAADYTALNINAMLAAPITAGEKRLGVLLVYAARAPIFADDDLVLAQLLADQAAVILESRALIDEAARVQAREEATLLKDDFLSAAAHDLKTPLAALVMQAQLMERRTHRDPTAPADLRAIERIVREAERLRRLVMELLDGSRVEQGHLVGPRELVHLGDLLKDACARHSTDRHRCVLQIEESTTAYVDASRIMQVIDNLLENAVKYSPDNGEIQVKLWREEDSIQLTVTDQGIGIPSADLSHLFDRFHRGTNVDDRRFAGMGLGLYICRGIVEQHGGRIWATSPGTGQGSTFHVSLPAGSAPSS